MKERNSELNNSYKITEGQWVISLVRKANHAFTQHAFIVLEGIEDDKPIIYFADFVGKWWRGLPNSDLGFSRYKKYSSEKEDLETYYKETPLIFRCEKRLMDIKEGDYIAAKHWPIAAHLACNLMQSIQKEKGKQAPFSLLGKSSVLTGSSAASSGKEKGHNCFSWAKEKLYSAGDSEIRIEEEQITQYLNRVWEITGLTVKSTQSASTTQCLQAIALFGVFAASVAWLASKNLGDTEPEEMADEKLLTGCSIM